MLFCLVLGDVIGWRAVDELGGPIHRFVYIKLGLLIQREESSVGTGLELPRQPELFVDVVLYFTEAFWIPNYIVLICSRVRLHAEIVLTP